MENKNNVLREDYEYIIKNFNMEILEGKTILITGATGLLGQSIIKALQYWNQKAEDNIKIIAAVRNKTKAEKIFTDKSNIKFWVGDIQDMPDLEDEVHYIIHGASQTESQSFVKEPVETIMTALSGTVHMLMLAKEKKVDGFVYLSSMEVYGAPETDEKITENNESNLNPMHVRSCYPESKRMCENLCTSYAAEYGVPARVVRLTQTFGPGITYDDKRVFAEFARCAIEKRDIILHTSGATKRNYLYVADAVTAILKVLLYGENGQAYNAANEDTYCSILEMAKLVAEECADGSINVRVETEQDINRYGYAPTLKMNLDTGKLKRLGWSPSYTLKDMYKRMIECMQ